MASALSYRAGIRQAAAGALALAFGLAAHPGGAAPPETEPIKIEYVAPAGCPSASEFSSRVFGRTSKARPAAEAEPARTFVVVIESSGSTMQGSLVVREDGMSTMARRVAGKDCDEVARALSLATALAIDPEAAITAPEPTGPNEGGAAGAAGGTASTPEPRQKDSTRRDDKSGATKPSTTPENEPRETLLVGASAAFGPAPNPGFGASVALEWSSPRPVVLPSAIGLELVFLTTADHGVRGASSSFDFVFTRPYVCTLGLALGQLGLVPCVGGALGAVVAKGSNIASPASEMRFWAAGELALRLDVRLSEDWFVDATGGAVFPFTRYRFVFENPDTGIHDVPGVTAAAGLRLGRRL